MSMPLLDAALAFALTMLLIVTCYRKTGPVEC